MNTFLPPLGQLRPRILFFASFFTVFFLSCTLLIAQPAIEWDKTFGGDRGDFFHSITKTSDGGYILAGDSESNISGDKTQGVIGEFGQSDFWVVKIAADGSKLWDRTYGGYGHDILQLCRETMDGGYILGGYSYSGSEGDKTEIGNGGSDFWIVKITADGTKEWDKSIGTEGDEDWLAALIPTRDGGYFLGGHGPQGASGDKTSSSPGFWLIKLTQEGEKEWDRTYVTTDQLSTIVGMEGTKDGNYIIAGGTYSNITEDKSEDGKGSYDAWIIKIQPEGSIIWDKTIGGSGWESISVIKELSNQQLVLFGNSDSPIGGDKTENAKGSSDFWVVKLDKDQNVLWDKTIGGKMPGASVLSSVEVTLDGGFVIGGETDASPNEDLTNQPQQTDYWVVKIDSLGNKVWDKVILGNGTDFAAVMCRAHDGGYLIGGQSFSGVSGDKTAANKGGAGDRDYWIVKLAAEEPSLPVTLADFEARKENTATLLTWKTTSETKSDYFEVQHSTTGKTWSVLGKVKSKGESSVENNYQFVHIDPVGGINNFYRLKMIDLIRRSLTVQLKQ
jgi:hypothetical protein